MARAKREIKSLKKEVKLTFDALKARGWKFKNHGNCDKCGDAFEWWESPQGNPLPFNPMNRGGDEAVAHKNTCIG